MELNKVLALRDIYKVIKDEKMPFKTSYNLKKLADAAEKHFKFYSEELNKLIAEYGDKDEDGNFKFTSDGASIQIQEEKLQECFAKVTELDMLDVDMPNVNFDIEDFGNIKLTPEEVSILAEFIG